MKVSELMRALKDCAPDAEVILQRDPEGNGYSPLEGADSLAVFDEEENCVYGTEDSAEDNCLDEEEWEELLKGPRCVVLFPSY